MLDLNRKAKDLAWHWCRRAGRYCMATNAIVPAEYLAQDNVADCEGVSKRLPLELINAESKVTLPALALITAPQTFL
jgi:hypothetical protein